MRAHEQRAHTSYLFDFMLINVESICSRSNHHIQKALSFLNTCFNTCILGIKAVPTGESVIGNLHKQGVCNESQRKHHIAKLGQE